MKRLAFKMKLRSGQQAAYIKRHNEIWPELKKLLKDSGISEYSIFLDRETDTLFAFQKVSGHGGSQDLSGSPISEDGQVITKGDGGSQDLADNPIVQKWWAYMADIMEVHPDNAPISIPLEEVFYLE